MAKLVTELSYVLHQLAPNQLNKSITILYARYDNLGYHRYLSQLRKEPSREAG